MKGNIFPFLLADLSQAELFVCQSNLSLPFLFIHMGTDLIFRIS